MTVCCQCDLKREHEQIPFFFISVLGLGPIPDNYSIDSAEIEGQWAIKDGIIFIFLFPVRWVVGEHDCVHGLINIV